MLDLTVVILTYNEELHIRRCLENVCSIAKDIIVVDCFSTDKTQEICRAYKNVTVVEHTWPGNQAEQFNWALDNLHIDTEWVLRIDADEYLTPELVNELMAKLPTIPDDITGIEFKRRHIFLNRWVKYGIYPVILLRMFRRGCGRYENRLMDEHITLKSGKTILFDNDFCDHSLINISEYCRKHINYAIREAAMALDDEYHFSKCCELHLGEQAASKHRKKSKYNNAPLFWRSFFYFLYRYILKGGFLDGKEGFLFSFIQGWWYRTLVDAKIYEIKRASGGNKERIRAILKQEYGIVI